METETHHCYGCGGSFAREELQYRPFGKGAYRKNAYYCPVCNEKQKKKRNTYGCKVIIPKLITNQTSKRTITTFIME